jgi:hypothetical protein
MNMDFHITWRVTVNLSIWKHLQMLRNHCGDFHPVETVKGLRALYCRHSWAPGSKHGCNSFAFFTISVEGGHDGI